MAHYFIDVGDEGNVILGHSENAGSSASIDQECHTFCVGDAVCRLLFDRAAAQDND
jgi:hypothetical protein